MKVPVTKASGPRLDQNEMNKLLEKTHSADADAMAVKGLGYAPCASRLLFFRHQAVLLR